jgi:hypothetical protein
MPKAASVNGERSRRRKRKYVSQRPRTYHRVGETRSSRIPEMRPAHGRCLHERSLGRDSRGHLEIAARRVAAEALVERVPEHEIRPICGRTGTQHRNAYVVLWLRCKPHFAGAPEAQCLAIQIDVAEPQHAAHGRRSGRKRAAGTRAAFTLDRAEAVTGRYAIRRVSIVPADGRSLFALKSSGRYIGWRQSTPVRTVYRAVRPIIRNQWLWH